MKSNLTCWPIFSTVQGSLHKHAFGLNIPLIIACIDVCRLAPISNGSHDSAKLTEKPKNQIMQFRTSPAKKLKRARRIKIKQPRIFFLKNSQKITLVVNNITKK